jgi:hypothetical protein
MSRLPSSISQMVGNGSAKSGVQAQIRNQSPGSYNILSHRQSIGTRWKDACVATENCLCWRPNRFQPSTEPSTPAATSPDQTNAFYQVCVLNCKIEYLALKSMKHTFPHRLPAPRVKSELRKSTRSNVVNMHEPGLYAEQ